MLSQVKEYFLSLQNNICSILENTDSVQKFSCDPWQNHSAGHKSYGETRIMQNGEVFTQAGVNFSHVQGHNLPTAASQMRKNIQDYNYQATGVSIVIHPKNPYVPTSHANVRFFIAEKPEHEPIWWFGGGFDLTPYYGFEEDCQHWHKIAYNACQPYGDDLYKTFKTAADDYFYLKHRKEQRGIGGLFFDDFNEKNFDHSFAFTRSIGDAFLSAYIPIVLKRKALPYGEREKNFQLYRRGRYVEFNLIYDRGTLFGLQSNGRTESILMSLPPEVHWQYNWQPEVNTPEDKLYTDFLIAKDWYMP